MVREGVAVRKLIATGLELQKFCLDRGWRSCVIGIWRCSDGASRG